MSVFLVDHQDHHPPQEQPPVAPFTYQTPPTPTLMAVLGPPKQYLTSECGLDALERRLLAEVGSRKHLEPWDHNHIITEEDEGGNGGTRFRMKSNVFKDHHHHLGRRDVRDALLSSSSPAGTSGAVNGNQRLPPIDTDLDLDLVRGEEGVNSGGSGGGNGVTAPIAIPMKSPDPLNESCISSLTLGGEVLPSALPDTGGAPPAAADSDGEGDGEAEFDGRTHRAGSASMSGDSNSSSDGMLPGGRGLHKHIRQRAEVSTPTEMIPQQRVKSKRGGSGGGRAETKERVKSSSSKKKERLTGSGKGTSEPKRSRNKSSAAAKGRVAAWLGGIDPAVPPQEEIIPPSPSVVRDSSTLSFEDEQRAALGSSPLAATAPHSPLRPNYYDSPTTPGGALAYNPRSDVAANEEDNEIIMMEDDFISASHNPPSLGFVPITTLNRNTISLPSVGSSFVRRPLLLSRDATAVEEAWRTQDLWSSTPPGITPLDKDTLKPAGAIGAVSLLPHEKIIRKPTPSSAFSKPASAIPLSYSAVVTSTPPSATASSSGATVTSRNVWRNADQSQSTSQQPKGRHVPPSTTRPPGYYNPSRGKLPMFPPSKIPMDPQVKHDIRSAGGGRGGKVSSGTSLWASGATNNHRHNHQTTATATAATASHSNVKDKWKEVPRRLFNAVEEASDTLPFSSSSALSKTVKTKKKLFSAAVMTPAPALKNVRTYTSPTIAASGSGGGDSSSTPKKMASTPALPVRSVGVLGDKAAAAASQSNDNSLAERPTPPTAITSSTMMNVLRTTPSASLSTSSSGPPGGKLHELTPTTKRGAAVNGPPGVMNKATSDPAVISSSHAVPTLLSTSSLVRPPHDPKNSTAGRKQDYYRHHLQPTRVAVVKLPSSTTTPPGSSGVGGDIRSGSNTPQLGSSPQMMAAAVVDNNTNNDPRKPAELAFGQARLRDLIKKYQAPSPGDGGQKT